MPRVALLLLPLVLVSCVNFPNTYAPAERRHADAGPDPKGLLPYIDMKDPASLRHLAGGINPDAYDGEKRKAEPRAQLHFAVPEAGGWRLVVDLDSPGPQGLSILVNGVALPTPAIEGAGRKKLELAVPAGLLAPASVTTVEVNSASGLSLYAAGFVRP